MNRLVRYLTLLGPVETQPRDADAPPADPPRDETKDVPERIDEADASPVTDGPVDRA